MLHSVVAGFMEEVAERDRAGGFTGKVQRKSGSGSSEYSDDRIQLLAAAPKIGTSDSEVGAIQRGCCQKADFVFAIPELVGGLNRLRHRNEGSGFD